MINKNKLIQSILIFSLFLIVCSSFVSAEEATLRFDEKANKFNIITSSLPQNIANYICNYKIITSEKSFIYPLDKSRLSLEELQILSVYYTRDLEIARGDIEGVVLTCYKSNSDSLPRYKQLLFESKDVGTNIIFDNEINIKILSFTDNLQGYNCQFKFNINNNEKVIYSEKTKLDNLDTMVIPYSKIKVKSKADINYISINCNPPNSAIASYRNIIYNSETDETLINSVTNKAKGNAENINTNSQSQISNNKLSNPSREIVNPTVEELIKKYRDLKVDHNTNQVSYNLLIDQTVENAVSSKALFDQAVGYIKIAEMQKKYLDIQETTPLEKEDLDIKLSFNDISFVAILGNIPNDFKDYKCHYKIILEDNTKKFFPLRNKVVPLSQLSTLSVLFKNLNIVPADMAGIVLYCYSSDIVSQTRPSYKKYLPIGPGKIDTSVSFSNNNVNININSYFEKLEGYLCNFNFNTIKERKIILPPGNKIALSNQKQTVTIPFIQLGKNTDEKAINSIKMACSSDNPAEKPPFSSIIYEKGEEDTGTAEEKPDFKPVVKLDDTKQNISIILDVGDKVKEEGYSCMYSVITNNKKNNKATRSLGINNYGKPIIESSILYESISISKKEDLVSINFVCYDENSGDTLFDVQIYNADSTKPPAKSDVCSTCGDNGRCTEKECNDLDVCGWLAEGGVTNFLRSAVSFTTLTAPMGSCKPLAVSKPPVTSEPVEQSTEIPEVPKDFTPPLTKAQATGKINKLYDSYGPAIEEAATQSGINKYLIYGILSAETVGTTGGNPLAVSPSGAIGLMQITFTTGCSYADKCVNENNKEVQYSKKTESGGYKNYKVMNDPNLYPQIFDKITFCGDCARQEKDEFKKITKDYDCEIGGSNCKANKDNDGRFNAGLSIKAGAYILKDKIRMFNSYIAGTELGIAAYNIGEGTIQNGIKLIQSPSYNIANPKQSTWLEINALATEQNLIAKGFFKNGPNKGLTYANSVLTYAHIAESVLKDKPTLVASGQAQSLSPSPTDAATALVQSPPGQKDQIKSATSAGGINPPKADS